ncbi:hypothetical protein F7725_004154, partial [Dissostichus mawsoni]
MESQCEYFMYFLAAPISTLSDPAEYTTLPRRKHVYLGEVVQFLLVLRSRKAAGKDDSSGVLPWKEMVSSLSAQASVCVAESRVQRPSEYQPDIQSTCSADSGEEEPGEERETGGKRPDSTRTFIQCTPHLTHNSSARDGRQCGKEPVQIVVTVWSHEDEKVEVREHGYLTLLQLKSPLHTFRQDLSTFKAQVSTIMNVLPPPSVQCQHMAVSGKHLTLLKVLNCSSQDEVCVRDVKIVPNYNSSYLPMMPDGSVLIVDNVCHQSAEVTVASFCRIDSGSLRLPSMLSALEEQNFLFQLQLQDTAEEYSSEWFTPTFPLTRYISSCYSLPSIRLDRPRLVMTASCPRAVRPLEHFWVKYTLLNNLQDFLAVRLIWNADAALGGQQHHGGGAVVCQSPLNNLGQCRKGSTLSFTVAFQILRTGLFELSQHMKLKLQFTASVSTPRWSLALPHHPARGSGSVMERRTITPPVGPPMGRGLYRPPENGLISLDKIAKRECKVLVLEPMIDTPC